MAFFNKKHLSRTRGIQTLYGICVRSETGFRDTSSQGPPKGLVFNIALVKMLGSTADIIRIAQIIRK